MYRGPGQKAPPSKAAPKMPVGIVCDPPLGQATVIPADQDSVSFTVLVRLDSSIQPESLQFALWHNHTSDEQWESTDIRPSISCVYSFNGQFGRNLRSYHYATSLSGQPKRSGPLKYTIKFRARSSQEWSWVNDVYKFADGELYYQSPLPVSKHLLDYFINLGNDFAVRSEMSETPDTALWTLESPTKPATGRTSGFQDIIVGTPSRFGRWMALVRYWTPWLSPEQGDDKFSPVKDVILCSFLRYDGLHLVLLAVSGLDNVLSILRSDKDGNVVCAARNDALDHEPARIIASVGKDYESAVAAVMYHARKIVRQAQIVSGEAEAEAEALMDGVKPEWMQNWYEGLTYCTWNGLGQQLSEEKILKAMHSLKRHNVHVTNLIIDDNWQSLDYEDESQFQQGWKEFEANREGFPNGLKNAITKIRKEHGNLQHIAVWHALLGYWGGISPDGKLSDTYKTVDVRMQEGLRPPEGRMRVIAEEDVRKFYEDFYRFLSEAGIDSVKTDAQFFIDDLEDADDRRRLIKTYQDAWMVSSLKWFSIKAISCMSQTPQILFYSQLPTNKPRILVRNSDDFFPDVPASHPWHIFCNAHNSLLTQHLNLLPDWDMFQTSHPWASFHGAARCISGGPVYITDEPDKHDVDLIQQMTAVTPRGNTVIMRPSIGKSTQHYTKYADDRLVRIGSYAGTYRGGTGLLGVFNVSTSPLTEIVRIKEFPGVLPDREYIVRAHSTGKTTGVQRVDRESLVDVSVPVQGWEILAAHPLQSLHRPSSSASSGSQLVKIGTLGLLGKMTGAAAVLSSAAETEATSGRVHLSVVLKVLGVLGIYIFPLPELSISNDFIVLVLGRVIPQHTVRKATDAANVLEIDVERAWTEMGLDAGWSNEVHVEIYIS